MNTAKIEALKTAAEQAQSSYVTEQQRLIDAGYKSQDRYSMLKDLKASADTAHAKYAKFAKGQINKELVKIIEADRPTREAAERSRSAWKMAKHNAAK